MMDKIKLWASVGMRGGRAAIIDLEGIAWGIKKQPEIKHIQDATF
jgi:hypothetical protein